MMRYHKTVKPRPTLTSPQYTLNVLKNKKTDRTKDTILTPTRIYFRVTVYDQHFRHIFFFKDTYNYMCYSKSICTKLQ